jgi:hypothetical protein
MAIKSAPPEPDLPNIRKHLRTRLFWRVFGWGGMATIALAAVALISQTEAGSKRLQLALASVSEPVRAVAQIPPRTAETEAETKRLAAQVRELAADRERLTARIATLERNLEDMTGSIKQQSEQLKAARAANTPPPAPSAPATTPAAVAVAPPPTPALPALTPLAMPALTHVPTAAPENQPPPAAETKTEAVRLPPVRVAAAPASEPAAEPPPPAKLEYGIDLGGAASIEALRMHWAAMKANYGPLLAGLHPLASQHPKHPTGVTYRVVAGPLPTAAEATKLCARFPVTRTGCHPAKFNGVLLAEP